MDGADFLIVRLRGREEPLPPAAVPFFMAFLNPYGDSGLALLRRFSGKWGRRLWYRWLRWRLPVACGPVDCLGSCGTEAVLPFSCEDLSAYTKEEIRDMLHRIMMEKGAQNIVVDRYLEPYLEKSLQIDGRMMLLLMADDILRQVCRKHQIARRELNLVIVASGPAETTWLIRKLGNGLNRLTVVTREPEAYQELAREFFEEEGLLVRVCARPLTQELYGNVVIELGGQGKEDCLFYRPGTIVLNLSGNGFRTIQARTCGRNLTCYNCFLIRAGGQVWDRRILQAVIFKTSTWMGGGQLQNSGKIKEKYGLEVEKTGLET